LRQPLLLSPPLSRQSRSALPLAELLVDADGNLGSIAASPTKSVTELASLAFSPMPSSPLWGYPMRHPLSPVDPLAIWPPLEPIDLLIDPRNASPPSAPPLLPARTLELPATLATTPLRAASPQPQLSRGSSQKPRRRGGARGRDSGRAAAERSRQAQGSEAETPQKTSRSVVDRCPPVPDFGPVQAAPSPQSRGGAVDQPPAAPGLGGVHDEVAQPDSEAVDLTERLAKLDSLVREFSKDVDGICGRKSGQSVHFI